MEETTGFRDWELLQSSDGAPFSSPNSPGNPKVSETTDVDSEDGAIKPDYFSLNPEKRHPIRPPSEDESEEGGIDSDSPSWVDPDSDPRYADRPRGQMDFTGTGFRSSGGFWSDESADGQRSAADSEKGELCNMGDSEMGFEGIELGHMISGGDAAVIEGGEGIETGQEKQDQLGRGELAKMKDGAHSSAQMSTGVGGLNNIPAIEGEKKGLVWWKMPLELLKLCVFRVRPMWSISIAAAFVGVIMLGRRLYKMKYKSRSITFKIAIDDKKVSQFMIHAARLNEAFSMVRRQPIIRPSLPAGGGVTPWPVVSFR